MSKILLIDDDKDIILANRMVLEASGHKVSEAYSGQEGWDLIPGVNPDVIILDVMMEEFNSGFTLAQDIGIKYPKIPMIVLSAVRTKMDEGWRFTKESDSDWLPVRVFLEKPIKPEGLLKAINEVLKDPAGN